MKYERFEDLPVWRSAADLASRMVSWATQPIFRGKGDLSNQLQRATLSISNNIAEGFERGSTAELIHFLYIARGSAGEVRSMLCVMERIPECDNLKPEISDLKSICESISRQLRGWANSLQNSDIKGQRHLADETRRRYDNKTRRVFQSKMQTFHDQQERDLNEIAEKRRRQTGNSGADEN